MISRIFKISLDSVSCFLFSAAKPDFLYMDQEGRLADILKFGIAKNKLRRGCDNMANVKINKMLHGQQHIRVSLKSVNFLFLFFFFQPANFF